MESPDELFEKKIRPVLVEHCYKCHASTSKRLKGGLKLDTRAGILKGGDSGPVIVPGKPEESLFLKALRYDDEDLQMPPKGKLPAHVIADFALWIKRGAPDPRDGKSTPEKKPPAAFDFEAARRFWAFKPPREPTVPDVKNQSWCRSPLDRFILAKLEAAGREPAPAADKRTLIRRATFDLTGLPPTALEIEAFLSDERPAAYARLVERLLASPHYGERWGRHWLDVARYADSNGVDENLAYANAFRYRDYVVDSFNRDLPFDRFIHEQLAGDLLPAGADESQERRLARLTATGFLSLGPKMLACDDGRKMELDIIDEQIDTVSRAFMAMTIACARCHDHKFDPIPTRDYYALAGIFKSTKTMENFKVVAQWHEHDVATATQQQQAAAHKEKLKLVDGQLAERTRAARDRFLAVERGKAAQYFRAAARVVHRTGPVTPTIGETRDVKPRTAPDELAKKLELNGELLRQWIEYLREAKHGGEEIWRELFAEDPLAGDRFADDDATPLIETYAERFDAANSAWVSLLAKKGGDTANQLSDPDLERFRAVLYDTGKGPFRLPKKPERFFTKEAKIAIEEIKKEKQKLEKSRPSLPRAMGVREGKIEALAVHIRGSYLTLGEIAPRGFPQVLAGDDQKPIEGDSSGRLALARWLTGREHPLTARVAVNRIWLGHFGDGLVRTPDNFGRLGERPTHPMLLDYLARRFLDSGWSIKAMHRLIMLSATYRMSTAFDPAAYENDPENRLWWRFRRRRLSAEEVRDAILALGGGLDHAMGGQLLPNKNRDYVTGTGSKEGTYEFNRRSIYLPVLRSAVYQMFQTFDFADPSVLSGRRASTTVATQALFMMNGKLVIESSRRLAEQLVKASNLDDQARVRRLYLHALGRPPTPKEVARSRDFVARYAAALPADLPEVDANDKERRVRAWQGLCRVVLAANEFVYVE